MANTRTLQLAKQQLRAARMANDGSPAAKAKIATLVARTTGIQKSAVGGLGAGAVSKPAKASTGGSTAAKPKSTRTAASIRAGAAKGGVSRNNAAAARTMRRKRK